MQQEIIVPARTMVHPCLDVVTEKYVHDIRKIIFNRNHTKHDL